MGLGNQLQARSQMSKNTNCPPPKTQSELLRWYFQVCFLLEATAAAVFRIISLFSWHTVSAQRLFLENCLWTVYLQCQWVCNRLIIPPPNFLSYQQRNAWISGSETDESNLVVAHLFSNKTAYLRESSITHCKRLSAFWLQRGAPTYLSETELITLTPNS